VRAFCGALGVSLLGAGALAALLLAACKPGAETSGTAASPAASAPAAASAHGISFSERAEAAGIKFLHTDGSSGKYFIVETLASGVILFDFDLDGDLDIYFPNGRPLPPSPAGNAAVSGALYRNDGGLKFTDVTAAQGVPGTGFGTGGAAADVDGDGDLDLYLCQHGPNVLYRNEGKEAGYRFSAVPGAGGADDPRFSAGASFFDFDRDGDLDLYVTNYCVEDFQKPAYNVNGYRTYWAPSHYEPAGHSLFKNDGRGAFTDVTREAGISELRGRGMGVVAADFDGDGWQDVYIANDASENFLLRNQRDGTFKEVGLDVGVALSANGDEQGSMGVDVADFNDDGRLDIFVTNFQKQNNALYAAGPGGFYDDVALRQGLGATCLPKVSWGTKFFDANHDGYLDLFIANGHLEDNIGHFDQSTEYLQQSQVFLNKGKGLLEDISDTAGAPLREKRSSRGAAFGDLDLDGDIDVVVLNSRARPSLFVNDLADRRSWLLLALRGRRNRFGVGATVVATAGGRAQLGVVTAGASYISQNDLRLHFGLGDAGSADVEVRWPEGLVERFRGLAARRLHELEEGKGEPGS
jgi:hypothetical protein